MGNVPISCCKSKSPRSDESSTRGRRSSSASRSKNRHEENIDNQPSAHILQHISEREPDDSETDPSSNPVDRPIFAARSCKIRNPQCNSVHSNYHFDNVSSCVSQRNEKRDLNSSNCSQLHGSRSYSPSSPDDCQGNSVDSFKLNKIESNYKIITQDDATDDCVDDRLNLNNFVNRDTEKLYARDTEHHNEYDKRTIEKNNLQILLRTSSCSTIYCDGSTISQPNLKQTIKGVSLAIYFHIKNRTSDNYVEIFDETTYPLRLPKNIELNDDEKDDKIDQKFVISDSEDELEDEMESILKDDDDINGQYDGIKEPDRNTIYQFVKTLFKAAQLSSEYAITTLVYLERLMTYAEMDLIPKTWRRMFLGAIVLSSKVWEDQAVWNVDYAQILEDISVEDINELERHFLGLIQFNMNVPSSVYAKYYFHLRSLALVNGFSKRYALMTIKDAKTLEVSRSHCFIEAMN